VKEVYQERLDSFRELEKGARTRGKLLSRLRFTAFVLAALFGLGSDLGSGVVSLGLGIAAAAATLAFLSLVAVHRRVRRKERWFGELATVNEVALARLGRAWRALPASSPALPDHEHPFAADLDVLGDASLYRLCTTITTPPGAGTLREWLLAPARPQEVRARQEAVAELAADVDFRQRLNAQGRLSEPPDPATLHRFQDWAEGKEWLATVPWLRMAAWILPLLTTGLLVMYMRGVVSYPWWLVSLGVAFAVASAKREVIHSQMDAASGGQGRFARYAVLLDLVLSMKPSATSLRELQESVRNSPVGAVVELRKLGRIVAWSDTRFNGLLHAPLQALLVWDIHVLAVLDRWRRRSGIHVRRWLEALGRLEALCALAALKADHPDWVFPVLQEDGDTRIVGRALGHPLLDPESCVRNDVEVGPGGTFLFVTGSNMSGKSTLLRAVGINVVLAQAGAPVCARSLTLPPLEIHTSMRTADSLAEGVSQYMAELYRIQGVVEGVRRSLAGTSSALYLLDEPLQGTNEAERRVAVQTILGHLLRAGAIGAVATHDLQLDRTEVLAEAARPVHFEGVVKEGGEEARLSFDFLLRPGPATSTNALALLRAVGLGKEETPHE
jgi:hypothetical protein